MYFYIYIHIYIYTHIYMYIHIYRNQYVCGVGHTTATQYYHTLLHRTTATHYCNTLLQHRESTQGCWQLLCRLRARVRGTVTQHYCTTILQLVTTPHILSATPGEPSMTLAVAARTTCTNAWRCLHCCNTLLQLLQLPTAPHYYHTTNTLLQHRKNAERCGQLLRGLRARARGATHYCNSTPHYCNTLL